MSKPNFCCPGPMSTCTAKEMEKCKFYDKSTHGKYCMYRVESILMDSGDFHCSCVAAQIDARKKKHEEDKKLIEKEHKEGDIDV